MNNFYDFEFELETRILGDIEFQSDQGRLIDANFDFTVEEIKQRYSVFLNFAYVLESSEEPDENNSDEFSAGRRRSLESSPEAIKQKEMQETSQHELKELESTSIENAYTDFNYWKPDVDHNVDELMSELNK